ncbi:hypothetical protein IW136_004291, partial [Coemansia sp. RSA 678]
THVTEYQKILQNEKTAEVAAAKQSLSAGSYTVPNLELFEEYLQALAEVTVELTWHYNKMKCNQRVGATMPKVLLHRKLWLSAYINQQQADQLL